MPTKPDRTHNDKRIILVMIMFLGITAFLLFTEHRAHVLGILPWVLLLACLLLHFLLHRKHREGHSDRSEHAGPRTQSLREGE